MRCSTAVGTPSTTVQSGLCLLLWIVSQVSSQDPTVPTLTPELPTDRTGVLTSPSGPGTSIANLETTPVLPPSGLKIPVVLPFSGNISKAPVNSGDLFGSVGYTREDEATTSTGNRKQFASLHGIPDDQIIYATTLTNLHFHIQPSLTEYTKSHSLVQSELSPLPTHSQNILTSFSGQNGDIPSSSFVPPEGVSASTADVLTNNFTQSSGHLQPSTTLSEAFSTLPLQIFTSSPSVPKGGATFNFGLQENRTVTHMFNQSDVVSLSFTGMSLLKDGLDPSPSNQNLLTTIFHSDLPTLHPKRDNSTESDGSLTIETSTGDGMNYTTVLPSGGLGVPATLGITLGCLAAVLTVCVLVLAICHRFKSRKMISSKPPTNYYTGLWDDNVTLSYINNHFDYLQKDPQDEMISLDNDAYLNSLEVMVFSNTWGDGKRNTRF